MKFVSAQTASLLLAAAALWLSSPSPVAAADSVTQAPFTAALAISESVIPTPATPCTLAGTVNGLGLSSFGPLRLTASDCIVFVTATSTTFKSVGATLWTTSGEQINVTYCGTGVMAQPTGPLVLTGRYQFTGGSGPFKKASGCGNLNGIEDLSPLAIGQPARGFVALTEGACSATGPECR